MPRVQTINTFSVGDLVKRTNPPYDYWVGIVVSVEVKKYKLYQSRPPQDMTTVWVQWTNIPNALSHEPESYWVDDLQVISKSG